MRYLALLLLAVCTPVWAAPGTCSSPAITVTDSGTGDPATGFELWSDCDIVAQTRASLVGPFLSGDTISVACDDQTATPAYCIVAVDAEGDVSGFDHVYQYTPSGAIPPGVPTIDITACPEPTPGVKVCALQFQ